MTKILPVKKIVKVLKEYEEAALIQMSKNELKETETIFSEESLENFETIGAMVQFMTVRDIANDLGLLNYLVNLVDYYIDDLNMPPMFKLGLEYYIKSNNFNVNNKSEFDKIVEDYSNIKITKS